MANAFDTWTLQTYDAFGQMNEWGVTVPYETALELLITECTVLHSVGDGGRVDGEIRNADGKVMDMIQVGG